jgi:hypothetical protein
MCAMNGAASGQEIIDAICADVRKGLQRDCWLAAHMVHDGFSFSAAIEVRISTVGQLVVTGTTIHGGNRRLDPPVSASSAPASALPCETAYRAEPGGRSTALEDAMADAILRQLRASEGGLTRTDIREYFQRNRSSLQISTALNALRERGLAHMVCRRENPKQKRPTERWYATAT